MKRALASLVVLVAVACGSASPGPGGQPLTVDQLKFKVMDAVGTPVYCDPDYFPVAREGGEQANAIATYPEIRDEADLYAAIIAHEHLPFAGLSDAQKLTVYRAFKLLRALTLTRNDIFKQPGGAPGGEYTFEYWAQSPTTIQLVKGTVTFDGAVSVKSKTPSGRPSCPICLAASARIATPHGDVPVIDIRAGMLVWTSLPDGRRVAAPVVEVGSTPVPAGHVMVSLKLADGRELLASPGHRTADGRPLGSLAVGDTVDGAAVTSWGLIPYAGDRTYDLLPAGPTGTYWANGILLSSTLAAVGLAGVPPAMTLSSSLPTAARREILKHVPSICRNESSGRRPADLADVFLVHQAQVAADVETQVPREEARDTLHI